MSWEIKKLGEVLQIERGGSPRPINKYLTNNEDGINWIKIADATASDKYIYKSKEKINRDGLHKTRMVFEDDFLLSNSMSFGRPYIMKTEGCIHDGWLVLRRGKEKFFLNDFLYYLLSSPIVFKQFDSLAAGSTVRNLNISLVSSVKVPIPPLSEQQKIVEKLDAAFALIDRAKANLEQNLQNAKELFQSKLNEVFSQKGEGWEEKKLGEVSKINYGCTEKALYEDTGYKYLRITDISEKGVNWDRVPFCAINTKDEHKYLLEKGDIVFARTGATTGKSYLFNDDIRSVFASYLIRLKINNKKDILPEFVNLFFQSGDYWQLIKKGISGSAQGGFNASKLADLSIAFPKSLEAQQKIVSHLDALSAQTEQLQHKYTQKLANLEELRKSVLVRAFKGE